MIEQKQRENITMSQLIERFFTSKDKVFTCNLCAFRALTITGVSVHWRKSHQHDTNIHVKKEKKENGGE